MEQALRNAIAAELQVEPETLTSDCVLGTLELWDSVTALTIMVLIGDAVGVPVEPTEIAQLKTFGDIEALVEAKRARK